MTSSVSMPPIDGRIDPLFDCLDNLCEFRHNASHSGFKDVCGRLHCLVSAHLLKRAAVRPERLFPPHVWSKSGSGSGKACYGVLMISEGSDSYKPSVKFEFNSVTLSDASSHSCHWPPHLVSAAVIKMNDSEVHSLCLICIKNFNSCFLCLFFAGC